MRLQLESILRIAMAMLWTLVALPAAANPAHWAVKQWDAEDGLRQNSAKAIVMGPQGYLWIGTEAGLMRFDGVRFKRFLSVEHPGLGGNRIQALWVADDGLLHVETEEGTARFDGSEFTPVDTPSKRPHSSSPELDEMFGKQDDTVLSVLDLGDGSHLVGSYRGIFSYVDGTVEPVTRTISTTITALARDPAGTVWIGTTKGVFLLERDGTITPLDADVPRRPVLSIFHDLAGNVWLGFSEHGLFRLTPRGVQALQRQDGLPRDSVVAVAPISTGGIWVATGCAGLVQADGDTITPTQVAGTCPWVMAEHPRGTVWFGTWGDGLIQYDLETGTVVGQYLVEESAGVVRALSVDPDNHLWIGTHAGIFQRLPDGSTRPVGDARMRRTSVRFFYHHNHAMWASTADGLARVDPETEAITWYDASHGLESLRLRGLSGDGRGGLLVATYGGGLHHFDGEYFRRLRSEDGFDEDFASTIIPDEYGGIWVSGNSGLHRFGRTQLMDFLDGRTQRVHAVRVTGADGMPSQECNGGVQSSGFLDATGMLYVPTMRGVAMVDTAAFGAPATAPRVHIEEVVTRTRQMDATARLELDRDERDVDIRYTAFYHSNPEEVEFRYRLDEGPYKAIGDHRIATFTHLRAGDHLFQVQARVGDGPWSKSLALAFSIDHAWYETRASRLGVLALIVTGIVILARRLRRREEKIQRLVDDRTHALARANQRLAELANEDSLTGVGSRRGFDQAIRLRWVTAARAAKPIALLMIDIDHFKAYNDRYGHPAGDRCLVAIAAAINDAARREADLIARYGGEEFAVILYDTDEAGARDVANRIRTNVAEVAKNSAQVLEAVTVSIGIASMVPVHGAGAGVLVEAADRALYGAKDAGRDCVVLASVAPIH